MGSRILLGLLMALPLWSADSTAIDIRSVVYPGPGCDPPVVRSMPKSPRFLDRPYWVEFEAVIDSNGIPKIKAPVAGRAQLPSHEDASATEESIYREVYLATAESVLQHSRFVPASCGSGPTSVVAVLKYSFDITSAKARVDGALGCADPDLIYKPAPPYPQTGPAAHFVAHGIIDENGVVTDVSFPSPPEIRFASMAQRKFDWTTYYENLILKNILEWKFRPAMCDGKPLKKAGNFDFYFHYPGH